ncbi:hypothetical protein N9219_01755 [bacterium]|nr:hypothetical protein [bacterium]
MAYIEEQQESRTMQYSQKSASTTRLYHMFDYPDSQDAIVALSNYRPDTILVGNAWCGAPEYDITPVFSDPDRTLYEAKVTWKTPDISAGGGGGGGSTNTAKDPQAPEDKTSLTISFGTTTEVLQNSISSGQYMKVNGNWLSLTWFSPQGINRQHPELPPEGTNVNVPTVIITAKSVIAKTVGSAAWQRARFNQLWTTNNAEWNGLEANHVMFTGMEMSQRSDDDWDLTYTFEYKKSTGDDAGNEYFEYYTEAGRAEVAIKRGNPWMIIDARYTQTQKTINDQSGYDQTVRNLDDVYTHNLYHESDFSKLGMVGID